MNRLRCVILFSVCALAAAAAAQDMPHEQVPFACTRCHADLDEQTLIEFDHEDVDFPLEGHHEVVSCRRCHDLRDFARAEGRCSTCHTDYHQGRLYPECETCHSPEGWDVIDSYDVHSRTAFQLMGAHVRLDCDACHEREIVAERASLTSECFDCHRHDYEQNETPPHDEFGFPTNCEECHVQFAWRPSQIPFHPGDFPIFAGTHAGEWDTCLDCHNSTGTWLPFSCVECHKHNEADMAEEHDDVDFYYYDSYGCYGCHPNGIAPEEDD